MRINEVTITGMHKVIRKTYKFNDDITYFVGENGSGKSTILEAVQLALLGYIPGYAKTNEGIMKHASSNIMSVELIVDNTIKIVRTWIRSGLAVKSNVEITGYNGDISELIGEVELPVFNFNEFKSMTSNKLKDWFITFLPKSDNELDVLEELKTSASTSAIPHIELLEETHQYINQCGLSGLALVRHLNTKFKEDQSFIKGKIAELEGTARSLVRYDDADNVNEEEARSCITQLNNLKAQLISFNTEQRMYEENDKVYAQLKQKLKADNINDDPDAKALMRRIGELSTKLQEIKDTRLSIEYEMRLAESELSALSTNSSLCPYTKEKCDKAEALAMDVESKRAEINSRILELQNKLNAKEIGQAMLTINSELSSVQSDYYQLQSSYSQLAALELKHNFTQRVVPPTNMTVEEINSEIANYTNLLVKAEANKRYNELAEKVRDDKFKYQNDLEILKIWIKRTDANGLQTEMMNRPFETLATEMTKYLAKMFNDSETIFDDPVKVKFNLSSKANSFSFGIDRNGTYIEFDYLSSGEKCLFMLSLIMCILDKSKSQIKTILIDDALDHLDDVNASHLFKSLKEVTTTQFILAGVQTCNDSTICKAV